MPSTDDRHDRCEVKRTESGGWQFWVYRDGQLWYYGDSGPADKEATSHVWTLTA